MSDAPTLAEHYLQLTEKVGYVDVSDRTLISITGNDRAIFLHNMCTNEINSLDVGQGAEAFLTTVQGKTVAHFYAMARQDDILLDTSTGQADTIIGHLERYVIREDVTLSERRDAELLVCGLAAPQTLAELAGCLMPDDVLASVHWQFEGAEIMACRYPLATWPAFLVVMESAAQGPLQAALASHGRTQCDRDAWETLRVEAGLPEYGRDIHDGNLPQEICRNAEAISFVKGCYLGQETVARIDALGQVNRLLVGVELLETTMSPGLEFIADGKTIGQLTSVAYSPRIGKMIGIAWVKRGHHQVGTTLTSESGEASVRHFPLQ